MITPIWLSIQNACEIAKFAGIQGPYSVRLTTANAEALIEELKSAGKPAEIVWRVGEQLLSMRASGVQVVVDDEGLSPLELKQRAEMIDSFRPDWAVGLTKEPTLGAQLCTRDGRRTGNAVIARIETSSQLEVSYTVITDIGTPMVLTADEIAELFHPLRFVMNIRTHAGYLRWLTEKEN